MISLLVVFCGAEKSHSMQHGLCVSLWKQGWRRGEGVLFSRKTLSGKNTVLGTMDTQRLKRAKPCSPAMELVSQAAQLRSFRTLPQAGLGGPEESRGVSPSFCLFAVAPVYPTLDPGDGRSVSLPFSLSQPTQTVRNSATHLLIDLPEALPLPSCRGSFLQQRGTPLPASLIA